MKTGEIFPGFNISAKGMSILRKKMNLIAENIAKADNVRMEDGQPYQRKVLNVTQERNGFSAILNNNSIKLQLNTSKSGHLSNVNSSVLTGLSPTENLKSEETKDNTPGDIVHMPDHPLANEDGYVQMSNVNVITEMVDMIAAARSYEANLTALNASKQMVKDTLEM